MGRVEGLRYYIVAGKKKTPPPKKATLGLSNMLY